MDELNNILKKVRDLFLRYGIKSVSMDDIAREMGMSKKTLYLHVENKAELVDRVLLYDMEQQQKDLFEIESEATDAIDEVLRVGRYVSKIFQTMNPSTVYDLEKYYRQSWERFERFKMEYIYTKIRVNLEKGLEEGVYRADLDPDVIARLYVGIMDMVTGVRFFPSPQFEKSKVYLLVLRYHIQGIASEKGLALLDHYQKQGRI